MPTIQLEPNSRTARAVVVLDSNLRDAAVLRRGVDPDALAIGLHSGADGLVQIAEVVAGLAGLTSLTIVAHGAPGGLELGQTHLDTACVLQSGATALAAIGRSLATDGMVQLVACDVAAGVDGRLFIQALANALGTTVCASTRPMGCGAAGSEWELDAWASPWRHTSQPMANLPIAAEARAAYAHPLAAADPTVIEDGSAEARPHRRV